MPKTIAILVLAAFSLTSLPNCAGARKRAPKKPELEHVVLVWLKRPGNEADRATLMALAKDLEQRIPEIKRLTVGRPLKSVRPIVDDSFDVGFVMRFKDSAAMNSYGRNPIHEKAAQELLLPLAKKVVVYDVLAE